MATDARAAVARGLGEGRGGRAPALWKCRPALGFVVGAGDWLVCDNMVTALG